MNGRAVTAFSIPTNVCGTLSGDGIFRFGGDHSRSSSGWIALGDGSEPCRPTCRDFTTTDRSSPLKVLDGNVTSVVSGSSTGFALLGNGQLVTMGQNDFGQALDSSLANLVVPRPTFRKVIRP